MSRAVARGVSRIAAAAAIAAFALALGGTRSWAGSLFDKVRVPDPKMFETQVELQGLYDEISDTYGPG